MIFSVESFPDQMITFVEPLRSAEYAAASMGLLDIHGHALSAGVGHFEPNQNHSILLD